MTPTDCLTATPADLAPIVAEIMLTMTFGSPGSKTTDARVHSSTPKHSGITYWYLTAVIREPDGEDWCLHFDPFCPSGHFEATRLMEATDAHGDRVAEWLIRALEMSPVFSTDLRSIFRIATASPLDRCRAACAAYLESKESKR